MGNVSDANRAGARPNYQPNSIGSKETTQSQSIAKETKVPEAASQDKTDVRRPLNTGDLGKILADLGKANSLDNRQLLMMMVEHGVETSQEAFEHLEQFIKGKKKSNAKESGVIAYSKGLKGNPKAIDLISNYLSHNLNFSKAMQQTMQKMQQFQQVLNNYSQHLDPSLMSGLSSILSEFITDFKKMKKYKQDLDFQQLISKRSESIQDIKYLMSFLNGLSEKLDKSKNLMKKGLGQLVKELSAEVSDLQDSLISQLILSKNPANIQIAEDYFHYWMIPNPLAQADRDIELLISKDPRNKKKINPEKTKLVIRLDTNDLGDLTIIIEVNEKKLHYKFYSNQELTQKFVLDYTNDLKKTMEDLSYEVVGVNTMKTGHNLKKLLFPTFDLNDITRISTEV